MEYIFGVECLKQSGTNIFLDKMKLLLDSIRYRLSAFIVFSIWLKICKERIFLKRQLTLFNTRHI